MWLDEAAFNANQCLDYSSPRRTQTILFAMLNLQSLTHLLRPRERLSANYVLLDHQLFTKQPIRVKHDRIRFVHRVFRKDSDRKLVDLQGESFYLLLIHVDNIAHFFHDVFFPLYYVWRSNKKRICVSIDGDLFQREFLESVIGKEYLIFLDRQTVYQFSDLILTPEGRDLKIYPDYLSICKEIKAICFSRNGITEDRTKNLLYGRNELSRKNLLDIDPQFLRDHHIELVYLSKLSFKDYLQTLARAKTFTYMVGAGVFNLLFLDQSVEVLEINPYRNNSWAQMFGLSELVHFHVIIGHRLKASSAATQDEAILDSHVYFDESIANAITALVTRHD